LADWGADVTKIEAPEHQDTRSGWAVPATGRTFRTRTATSAASP
jgi:crotonobetainyl-CoA:carnitine CoA-transferase CaiB-like acyl-CoA transferase